ncbi:hypothetical protein BT67DRAFT_167288 [Trichocladium antarcticum]|uniref:Uncharacterized protein n=1 Tax=Trichocladium antarcticum TaxID=1450529 RepID=A0AAN6ZAV1_9PEZI|nr:hypothetical protein BT67DRAFT_167288 [Trichocladium antarcticum]
MPECLCLCGGCLAAPHFRFFSPPRGNSEEQKRKTRKGLLMYVCMPACAPSTTYKLLFLPPSAEWQGRQAQAVNWSWNCRVPSSSPALGRGSGPCPAPPTTTGEAGIFPRSHVAATRLVAEHGLGRGHSRGSAGRLVSFAPSRPQTRSKKQSRTGKHTSRTRRTLASAQLLPTPRAVSRPSAGHRQPVHSPLRSTPYPSTTKRQLAASL